LIYIQSEASDVFDATWDDYYAQMGSWYSLYDARHAGSRLAGPTVVGWKAPGHAGLSRGEGRAWAWPRPRTRVGLEPWQEAWLARARLPARFVEAGPLLMGDFNRKPSRARIELRSCLTSDQLRLSAATMLVVFLLPRETIPYVSSPASATQLLAD
jgi:hypothetical protein